MSSYTDDVYVEFNDFEDSVGISDAPLTDYIEWLEEVIAVAGMRLEAARQEIG